MKILVYDVPAESSGALTILESYYEKLLKDKKNQYVFVISTPPLISQKNIKVLKFPWVKKSKLHRFYFDYIYSKRINKKEKPDRVISLQNLKIPRFKSHQTIYVHQVIPFSDLKFNILSDFNLWFYKHIYKILLFSSIRNADQVIVQSKWLKNLIVEKSLTSSEKIKIEKPLLKCLSINSSDKDDEKSILFIYPAGPEIYKNHQIIVDALIPLFFEELKPFKVIFTITGDENAAIKKLSKIVAHNKLPVCFIGNLSKKELIELYRKSILLYPSKIESLGLPLYEAMQLKRPIIAIDEKYVSEALRNYNDYILFNGKDFRELHYIFQKQLKV